MSRFNEFRWAVATTLAKCSVKPWYRPIKGLLALSILMGCSFFAYHQGKTVGRTLGQVEGVDFLLQACYHNGGFVMNEAGQTIVCGPLTQVPQEELDNFKKKV